MRWGLVMWLFVWQRLNMSAVQAVLAYVSAAHCSDLPWAPIPPTEGASMACHPGKNSVLDCQYVPDTAVHRTHFRRAGEFEPQALKKRVFAVHPSRTRLEIKRSRQPGLLLKRSRRCSSRDNEHHTEDIEFSRLRSESSPCWHRHRLAVAPHKEPTPSGKHFTTTHARNILTNKNTAAAWLVRLVHTTTTSETLKLSKRVSER